jgi:hypothetical protein
VVNAFCGECSLGGMILVPVVGATVGGLVGLGYGALIDWVIPGRERLYSKTPPGARVKLTPVLFPGRFGVAGAIRW